MATAAVARAMPNQDRATARRLAIGLGQRRNDMWQELLQSHGSDLLSAVTSGSDLNEGQAERLLPPALGGIGEALSGGSLDLGALLGGGSGAAGDLLSQLDLGGIARAAGLDEGQVQSGLQALIPLVLSLLSDEAGGIEGLLGTLGGGEASEGGLGALAGLTGKLLGR
jgi:hypothetical protein